MPENIDNIVIEHLKSLRIELREFRSLHESDISDLKQRLTHVERGMLVAGFRPFLARPGTVTTNEEVNALREAEGI